MLYSYETETLQSFYDYCPQECSSDTFEITTSAVDFPTAMYVEILKNNTIVANDLALLGKEVNYENVKQNFLWVNIYYDRSAYTVITQSPTQQFVDLMSNIGGTMGLYIGKIAVFYTLKTKT